MQVLQVLQEIKCPKPIKVCEEPVAEEPYPEKKGKKKATGKQPKKNKKSQESSKPESVSGQVALAASSDGDSQVYKAGGFQKEYHKFLSELKESGKSHQQAVSLWKESSVREALLRDIPQAATAFMRDRKLTLVGVLGGFHRSFGDDVWTKLGGKSETRLSFRLVISVVAFACDLPARVVLIVRFQYHSSGSSWHHGVCPGNATLAPSGCDDTGCCIGSIVPASKTMTSSKRFVVVER